MNLIDQLIKEHGWKENLTGCHREIQHDLKIGVVKCLDRLAISLMQPRDPFWITIKEAKDLEQVLEFEKACAE